MMRIVQLATLALFCCAGCRNPAPAYDPFLGQQTIPPPGTAVPPPGQPYYGAPPTVSPGAPMAPPMGALPNGQNSFTTASAGNGFSSFSPNVSPLSPATNPGATPNNFGRPPITPVSSPVTSPGRPSYGPPGPPAYPQASTLNNPAGLAAAQATAPQPLDLNRMLGPSSGAGQPTPAVAQAAQWQASDSAKKNGVTPASYSSPSGQNTVRVIEPASAASGIRNAPVTRAPELTDLPPVNSVNSNQLQPFTTQPQPPAVRNSVRMPASSSNILANVAPASATAASAANVRVSNYGYDTQYRWLKGKLEYSQSTRSWSLRYIPAEDAGDQFGGSVKLADAGKLNGFANGDFVVVQGSVAKTVADQGSYAPLYNIERIQKQ